MVAEVDLSAANLEGLVHRVCELVHTRTNFFKAYAPNAPMLMLMTATPGSGGLVFSEFERPRDYEPPASQGIPRARIKCGKRSHARSSTAGHLAAPVPCWRPLCEKVPEKGSDYKFKGGETAGLAQVSSPAAKRRPDR